MLHSNRFLLPVFEEEMSLPSKVRMLAFAFESLVYSVEGPYSLFPGMSLAFFICWPLFLCFHRCRDILYLHSVDLDPVSSPLPNCTHGLLILFLVYFYFLCIFSRICWSKKWWICLFYNWLLLSKDWFTVVLVCNKCGFVFVDSHFQSKLGAE